MAAAETLKNGMEVLLFPNPTNGVVNITIANVETRFIASPTTITIEIFDMVGKRVYMWQGEMEDHFIHPVDLSKESPGQYLVRVKTGTEIASQIVVLNK